MSLKSAALTAFLIMSSAFPLHAFANEAAAPWPERAEGRELPRASWVLVIPARRKADGTLIIWDREDPWIKEWRVPKTIGGLRFVTLFGDSEDRRAVTASAIDEMMTDEMRKVTSKYGAPALALAVTNDQEIAVAGWVPGSSASWRSAAIGETASDSRGSALAALSLLFGSRSIDSPAPASADDQQEEKLPDGKVATTVTIKTSEPDEVANRLMDYSDIVVTIEAQTKDSVKARIVADADVDTDKIIEDVSKPEQ